MLNRLLAFFDLLGTLLDLGHLGSRISQGKRTAFERKLDEIDWGQYQTAYGVAIDVPKQLERLASKDEEMACAAAEDLDAGLCHQHVDIDSAALPALPFLLEVLDSADQRLTCAILDILDGFATCTKPDYQPEWNKQKGPWVAKLREALRDELPRFRSLQQNPDECIRDCVHNILANLA